MEVVWVFIGKNLEVGAASRGRERQSGGGDGGGRVNKRRQRRRKEGRRKSRDVKCGKGFSFLPPSFFFKYFYNYF